MIIVRIYFGLGNQMFQYAYARALQEKGYKVYIDTQKKYDTSFDTGLFFDERDNMLNYFNIKVPEARERDIAKYSFLRKQNRKDKLLYWLANRGMWFNKIWSTASAEAPDEEFLRFGNCYLSGLFQNEKYFKDIRDILLKELRPKHKIRISRELREMLNDEEIVAVHIRRGDYVKLDREIPLSYYQNAFEKIEMHYKNPKYLVFSDDIEWVKEQFKEKKNVYFISDYGHFEDYEELVIMSHCKSNIIANSTFSWWGAWLNKNPEKIVIAPPKWLGPLKDVASEDWIII